jgi:hypothetical protein
MAVGYEEIINGESLLRLAPDGRHERICQRLHELVASSLAQVTSSRLLSTRSVVRVSPGSILRPDLALVTAATGKLWLAAEIINSQDHRTDTMVKKALYDETKLPRLWIIDPRYDNIEIYHGSPYGLVLRRILANEEVLEEPLIPEFKSSVKALLDL